MTRLTKLWLLIVLGFSGYVALAVMLGMTPGRGSDGFGKLAALIDAKAEDHGRVFTGVALFMIGCVFAALGVIRGDGGFVGGDGDAGGGGWFDGCDGDGGGD